MKSIIITGATSGIGRACAHTFAKAGYQVGLTARRGKKLIALAEELQEQYDISCHIYDFDVRQIEACEKAVKQMAQDFNQIDILLNNAGLAKGLDPIDQGSYDHWSQMIDTNIKGLLHMTRLISPLMIAKESGHIINICSTAGHEVYPKGGVYCATKHAVDALTKGMRLDFYKHGLKVSQISPAHVEDTEFARVRFDGDQEKAKIYKDFNPLKAEDVAETILFIASRPAHVNIQDVLLMGTQQANSTNINRTGRIFD